MGTGISIGAVGTVVAPNVGAVQASSSTTGPSTTVFNGVIR